jgi:hypothetical protein
VLQTIGLLVGIGGLVLLIISPALGCVSLIFGALFVAVGAKAEKQKIEERRHQETIYALHNQNRQVELPMSPEQYALAQRAQQLAAHGNINDALLMLRTINHSWARSEIARLQGPPNGISVMDPNYKP